MSQDLAFVLFSTLFHVRAGSFPASVRSVHGLCRPFVAVVGVSIVSPEFPGSNSNLGNGTAWSDLVARCRGAVLSSWPWVVRYCSYSQVRKIAIAVICISPALRFYLSLHQVNIYSNTFCRLDGLMAGALLAVVIRSVNFVPSKLLARARIAFLVSAPLAVVTEMAFHARWIVFSLTALASVSFIYLALFSAKRWLRSVLTNRFLVYTGTISYGIYLLEKIPLDAAKTFHLDKHQFLALPITAAATYAMAALSWTLLERPILRLKRFFDPRSVHPGQVEGKDLSLAER